MKKFKVGNKLISSQGPCFIIAEIGHNHQGDLDKAIKMIQMAAACGADAVKFQKRYNKALYTKEIYNRPYDNENSFGPTYGAHREALELGYKEYKKLIKESKKCHVEFMCTPFDFQSVDFLEDLGINSYKIASADLTSFPFLEYIAKKKKPMFISTGAADMEEVRASYKLVSSINKNICLMHCVAIYPSDYEKLNLNIIKKYKKEFPDAVIGYASHENGIIGPILAYMLGATVTELHFTLSHAWKGTDHKFSLEPQGLHKVIRDLRRVDVALGRDKKLFLPEEREARIKMGKSIYYAKNLKAGTVLSNDHINIKSPGGFLSPLHFKEVIGRRLKVNTRLEQSVRWKDLE